MSAEAMNDLAESPRHSLEGDARPQLRTARQRRRTATARVPSASGRHRVDHLRTVAAEAHIDELCAQMVEVCESAVAPLEIAAALEFDGLGDQAVRERYGRPDVFALAEEMYRRVPRQPTEPARPADPYSAGVLRPVLHGLLYGLPAVCFPAATRLLAGPAALTVLVVSLLASWTISQGLAYLGYLRLGRTDVRQARRLLRAGLLVGMAMVVAAMYVTTLIVPAQFGTLAFGVGQGAYMLGASVLMVLGLEQLLIVVLAPGVLGATAFLLLGRPAPLEHAAWTALAASPILALAIAIGCTSRTDRPKAGKVVTVAELRAALPSAGFGLLAAGLLAFPVALGVPGHPGANVGALVAAVPLSLSMGAAEWTLYWYRRRTQRLLRTAWRLVGFSTRARLLVIGALLQYLVAAVVLTIIAVALVAKLALLHLTAAVAPELMAYLALGGAMFLSLLLQTFGERRVTLLACTAALGYEVAFRNLGAATHLVAYAGLLLVLGAYATVALGRAVRHAY